MFVGGTSLRIQFEIEPQLLVENVVCYVQGLLSDVLFNFALLLELLELLQLGGELEAAGLQQALLRAVLAIGVGDLFLQVLLQLVQLKFSLLLYLIAQLDVVANLLQLFGKVFLVYYAIVRLELGRRSGADIRRRTSRPFLDSKSLFEALTDFDLLDIDASLGNLLSQFLIELCRRPLHLHHGVRA